MFEHAKKSADAATNKSNFLLALMRLLASLVPFISACQPLMYMTGVTHLWSFVQSRPPGFAESYAIASAQWQR